MNLLFVDRLAGIFLVDALGGTGYTDEVIGDQGERLGGFIVLDAGVLQRLSANEWATWKEWTPFKPEPPWQLEARIERDAQDSQRNAIQYILLHELGHVLSVGANFHPPWTISPKEAGPAQSYPFFGLSWQVKDERYASRFDDAFTLRSDVVYYAQPKLPASRMVEVYSQLSRTNFPSLYAATRPGDDFAEAFANYVHVVMMGRPWSITIRRGGEVVQETGACWEEPRCAAKRRLLEGLFQPP